MGIANKLAFFSSLWLAAGCIPCQQRQASYTPEPARGGQIISSGPYVTTQPINEAERALESALRDELNRYGDLGAAAPNVQISAETE